MLSDFSSRRLSFLALMLILIMGAPTTGEAQTARKRSETKETAGYRQAIDAALQEVQLSNFEEAREQFARAHALYPNARTLRGLGISEFELRHYVSAIAHLEQALTSQVKPLDGRVRDETVELLERAKGYTGALRIALSPASADVIINGVRVPVSAGEPVRLDIGEHQLEFRASGYATERRQVTVRGGQTEDIEVRLASLAAPEPQAESASEPISRPDATRSERVPVYKRWWLWTVVGVVVAGAAAGTAIALTTGSVRKETRAVPTENTPAGAGIQPLVRY